MLRAPSGYPLGRDFLLSQGRETSDLNRRFHSEGVLETDAAGFVLAGGRSSRMGADKSLVHLNGQPLAFLAVATLRGAGLSVSIAGGQLALAALAPLIEDHQPGLGPLSGICAALASTSASWAVFLPVDLPLLPASLVVYLLHHAKTTGNAITIPSINGFAQTFPAVLNRSVLPIRERDMQSAGRGCFSAFQAAAEGLAQQINVIPVEAIVQCGQVSHPLDLPPTRWFLNLNTADDLRQAEIHSAALLRVS
jgi:molybdopterin-guanine dinucleotide biosynthesis protein A